MKDPQIHPLGLFNISVFNRSDSDTRLRASISFAASTKTNGLCVLCGTKRCWKVRAFMKRVDIFWCHWGRVLWTVDGSGTGSAVCQAPADCRLCFPIFWRVKHVSSFHTIKLSHAISQLLDLLSSFEPFRIKSLLDDVILTSGTLSCAMTICSHCRRDLELKNVQGTVRLPSAFQVGLWQERGHVVQTSLRTMQLLATQKWKHVEVTSTFPRSSLCLRVEAPRI